MNLARLDLEQKQATNCARLLNDPIKSVSGDSMFTLKYLVLPDFPYPKAKREMIAIAYAFRRDLSPSY